MNMQDHNNSPLSDEPSRDSSGAKSVIRMLQYLFVALRVLIVIVIVLALFQGVFFVRDQEHAMLFRFGRLVSKEGSEILRSGRLYWAWPYPIDEVKRIPAERAVTLQTTHFWPKSQPADLRGEPGESAGAEGLIPGVDGYLLTGDANLVHLTARVTYRIADAKKYYLDYYEGEEKDRQGGIADMVTSKAAEEVVRNSLENAILKVAAAWSADDILKRSRSMQQETEAVIQSALPGGNFLNNAVRRQLEEIITDMDVGIEISKVNVTEVQPPAATAKAFQRINDALQERDTLIKDAQAYENQTLNDAQSRKAEILAQAQTYEARVKATVQADLEYFEKVLKEYRDNPETMLIALYTDTVRDVLSRTREKFIIHARRDGQQEVRLLIGREPESSASGVDDFE